MSLLNVRNVTMNFGGINAIKDVSFEVNSNELVGLIGPNGAGKTTLFNILTGVYVPTSGEILFSDKSIVGQKTYKVTQLGIARTFQNIRLFKELSVIDNVKVAMNKDIEYGTITAMFRLPKFYRIEKEVESRALELLEIVGLKGKSEELAKNLPYGEQRKLEIARALATNPKLLFLDEPAAGMNPQETNDLTSLIQKIKSEYELTIVLIEHDMSLVMSTCDKIYVLDYGLLIANGSPEEIKKNKRVIEAYLGEVGDENADD